MVRFSAEDVVHFSIDKYTKRGTRGTKAGQRRRGQRGRKGTKRGTKRDKERDKELGQRGRVILSQKRRGPGTKRRTRDKEDGSFCPDKEIKGTGHFVLIILS